MLVYMKDGFTARILSTPIPGDEEMAVELTVDGEKQPSVMLYIQTHFGRKDSDVKIGWSAYGSDTPVFAQQMAYLLGRAADLAQEIQRKLDRARPHPLTTRARVGDEVRYWLHRDPGEKEYLNGIIISDASGLYGFQVDERVVNGEETPLTDKHLHVQLDDEMLFVMERTIS